MGKKGSYTIKFKREVILKADSTNISSSSRQYAVDRKNIRRWMQDRENIFHNSSQNLNMRRRFKPDPQRCRNPEGEKRVYDWFCEQRRMKNGVSRLAMMKRMNDDQLEHKPMITTRASFSWIQRFMSRYNLSLRRISGSGRSFPSDTKNIIQNYLEELHRIMLDNNFTSNQVFDETSFYMDMPSSYTFAHVGDRKTYAKSIGKGKNRLIIKL